MKLVRLSAIRTYRLYPQEYFWYSFLLDAESTPEPQCGRKDYVNKKFQWHHRESNPRSASTNCATAFSEQKRVGNYYKMFFCTEIWKEFDCVIEPKGIPSSLYLLGRVLVVSLGVHRQRFSREILPCFTIISMDFLWNVNELLCPTMRSAYVTVIG
jgi:hypothetical protein